MVVSYKTLAEQIERLSGQLRNAGLKPGECVAIALPNSLEFLVVFLALTHARLVAAHSILPTSGTKYAFSSKMLKRKPSLPKSRRHCEGSHRRPWFADVATAR
jgi:acyl-CoA synthetase (AMP-forming)/AMP-acid ligase II